MKYLKMITLYVTLFFILNLIITTLSYFGIVNDNTILLLKRISMVITNLVTGLYIGMNSKKKGYLEGIKIGIIVSILMILLTVFIPMLDLSINSFIYYLLTIGILTLGSTIGINLKKAK